MRTLAEIKADAAVLKAEIEAIIDNNGHMHAFGPLAYIAVLDARPELKARSEALEKEFNAVKQQDKPQ